MPDAVSDLTVVGFVAVLQRLSVPCTVEDVGGGAAGALLHPTLTCDAVLVALELAGSGWAVESYFNHPGSGREQDLAVALMKGRIASVVLGPNCGTSMELQISYADKKIIWYNDPTPGLRSLSKLPQVLPQSRALYLDLYDWLEPLLPLKTGPLPQSLLYLNAGRCAPDAAIALAKRWRPRIEGELALQLSAPDAADLDDLARLARDLVNCGADLCVATAGEKGLAVANSEQTFAQPARKETCITDSSGAGAAVSAAVLRALHRGDTVSIQKLAALASEAGWRRCQCDGAVDPATFEAWAKLRSEQATRNL